MQSVRGFEYGVIHCLPDQDIELSCFINKHLDGFSLSAQELIDFGSVYINHQRATTNTVLKKSDYVRIHRKPRRFHVNSIDWQQRFVFENDQIVIVNKPAGIPCHPTVDNIKENLLFDIEKTLGKKFYITHRLDIPTQGLLVLAKDKLTQNLINTGFAERKIKKIYQAHSNSNPIALGLHEHYMIKSPRAPKTILNQKENNTDTCQLIVHQITDCGKYFQYKIELLTGRTHQIRAQFSHLGAPIIGDLTYGGPAWDNENAIALWSAKIEIPNGLLGDFNVTVELQDSIS